MPEVIFYSTAEVNHKISHRTILFKPKGMCKFKAELTYKFMDIVYSYILETDYKVTRQKFAIFTKKHLDKIEKEFFHHVYALKFQALLDNDINLLNSLNDTPAVGEYRAYVLN
jgi:hypothetical protein